ncbi:LacI family DNA-binding transcriptional regulator [Glaesserella sp.]|uniref:LacI family DNA-binding transcriptional regulator n=1 Tax=Glaesserella sp. TaxID=2094731 RepID=UPI00359FCFD3
MATVREVAAFAGVSIATVSRALNSPETLSPESLRNVMQAINALDYQVKIKPKKMTNLFGVIFPNISNPFFADLLEVLEQESYLHGRCILFFNSKNNARQELIALHECEAHEVDGVFLVPVGDMSEGYQDRLNQFKYQTVILTRSATKLPSVSTDHQNGGRQIAAHLLSAGHSVIGYIGIMDPFDDKYHGFAQYLSEQGYLLKTEHCLNTHEKTSLADFLKSAIFQYKVTAFGCSNDVLIQQVLETCQAFEQPLPEISIVGFDNTIISRLMKFSTISQPMREIAHTGFELMIEALKNAKSDAFQPQLLLPKLIIR